MSIFRKFSYKDIINHSRNFPHDQYYRTVYNKYQAVIHHTVSGEGAMGDIKWWKMTKARVATAMIIGRKGEFNQCFSTKFWAHHLGIKTSVFKKMGLPNKNALLNKYSIGIELDSWGQLTKKGNNFYSYTGKKVDTIKVQVYDEPYRGSRYYEKYTDEQIDAMCSFLVYLNSTYNIPLDYHEDMWDVSENALIGVKGIWTHTSYRDDKSDCHPQPELIAALKKLSKLTDSEKREIWK